MPLLPIHRALYSNAQLWINGLLVADLKAICHLFYLSKYGRKDDLRGRVQQLLKHLHDSEQQYDLMELIFAIKWACNGMQSAKDFFAASRVPVPTQYVNVPADSNILAYSPTAPVRILGNQALNTAANPSPYGQRYALSAINASVSSNSTGGPNNNNVASSSSSVNSSSNSINNPVVQAPRPPVQNVAPTSNNNRPPLLPVNPASASGNPMAQNGRPQMLNLGKSAFSNTPAPAKPKPVYDNDPKWVNSPFYSLKSLIGSYVVLPGFSTNPFKFWFEITTSHLELLQSTLKQQKQMNEFPNMDDVPKDFPNFVWSVYIMCLKGDTGIKEQVPIDFPCKPKISIDGRPAPKFVARGFDGPCYVPCDVTLSLSADGNTITKKKFNVEVDFDIAPNNYVFYVYLARTFTLPSVHNLITSESLSHQSTTKVRKMIFEKNDEDIATTQVILGLKCPLLYTDIRIPARGYGCDHLQCFDLFNYLMLQQKSAIWTCPVCNANEPLFSTGIGQGNLVKYDETVSKLYFASQELGGVQVCDYTLEIIEEIRNKHDGNFDDVQVVLTENGDWKVEPKSAANDQGVGFDNENQLKRSRESSASVDLVELVSSPSLGSQTNRRAPAIIDLTLSP